jgi:multiple antibiotic resistance protein
MGEAIDAFLLAFPALFSIVNPFGNAFIIEPLIGDLAHADRSRLVRRVALYCLLVMLGALWVGAAVLHFFGVSLEALRLGGGLVIVLSSLELLMRPEARLQRKQGQAEAHGDVFDRAFFPLTMPLTTGPGTISVAIALGSERPEAWPGRLGFLAGASLAGVVLAGLIWLVYWSAERLSAVLSRSAQGSISRLSAFLLLCIGVQIMITGAVGVAGLLHPH